MRPKRLFNRYRPHDRRTWSPREALEIDITKFATSVRFLVKDGEVDAFMNVAKEIPNVWEVQGFFAKTDDHTFVAVTIFENEQALLQLTRNSATPPLKNFMSNPT